MRISGTSAPDMSSFNFLFLAGCIAFQVCKRIFITPASTRMSDGGSKTMDRNVPFSSAARPTTVSLRVLRVCVCGGD